MRARQGGSPSRHLPSDRAERVELQLRARADQLKPSRTALGVCRVCTGIVYTGDSLAMAGGSLLHGECAEDIPV